MKRQITRITLGLCIFYIYTRISLCRESNADQVQPLTILYNSTTNNQLFADMKVIKKIQFSALYQASFTHIIFCCPSKSNLREESQLRPQINDELFVEKIFTMDESIKHYKLSCQERYEPSIRYTQDDPCRDIGYYIRFDNEKIEAYKLYNIKDFPKRRADIYFFGAFFLCYDDEKSHSTISSHTVVAAMHSHSNPLLTCKDFPFAFDIFSVILGRITTEYYSIRNQKRLFQQANLSALDESVQNLLRNPTDDSPPPYGYFVMYRLIPIHDYNAHSMIIAACIPLNVIPIWQKVAEGPLKIVDHFIRRVADVIGEITVISGTHDILDLSKRDQDYKTDSPLSLMKIAIPKILWKWLSYFVKLDGTTYHYSIIIVTHNEPTELVEKICDAIVCKTFGWTVGNDELDIGITYCCWATEEFLQLLDMKSVDNTRPFDLRQVPVEFNDDLTIMRFINVIELLNVVPALNKHQIIKFAKLDPVRGKYVTIKYNEDNDYSLGIQGFRRR